MDQYTDPEKREEQRKQDEAWTQRVIEMEKEEQRKMKSIGITVGIVVGLISFVVVVIYIALSIVVALAG